MNYELAKELKETGFPQQTQWYYVQKKRSIVLIPRLKNKGIDYALTKIAGISAPTLKELIEACGDLFQTLTVYPNKTWRAISNTRAPYSYDGRSPEEAVARLWLASNKK